MDFFDGFADLTGSFNDVVEGSARIAGMAIATGALLSLASASDGPSEEQRIAKPLARLALGGLLM